MAFLHLLSFLPSGGSVLCSSDYWLSSPKLLLLCDPVLQKKKKGKLESLGFFQQMVMWCGVGGKEGPCGRFWLIFVSVRK